MNMMNMIVVGMMALNPPVVKWVDPITGTLHQEESGTYGSPVDPPPGPVLGPSGTPIACVVARHAQYARPGSHWWCNAAINGLPGAPVVHEWAWTAPPPLEPCNRELAWQLQGGTSGPTPGGGVMHHGWGCRAGVDMWVAERRR